MNFKIKNIFKIKTEWWAGYRIINFMFGKMNLRYAFLGYRNNSWKLEQPEFNSIWKMWYSNPIIAVKKWDKDSFHDSKRLSICIFFNDFMLYRISSEDLNFYYDT